MTLNNRGFTLVELLVVIGMISVITGALTTSITSAQNRARIQKAKSEVKIVTQAILAYENYAKGSYEKSSSYLLKPVGSFGSGGADADAATLKEILGNGDQAQSGGTIPTLLMAVMQSGGKMLDPWGTPYKIYIRQGAVVRNGQLNNMKMSISLPNFYRLKETEREL